MTDWKRWHFEQLPMEQRVKIITDQSIARVGETIAALFADAATKIAQPKDHAHD